MAIELLDLGVVIQKIKDANIGFKQLGGALDVPTAESEVKAFPAAWVIPLIDSATENMFANDSHDQAVTAEFGVLIAIRNLSNAGGKASVMDLTVIRQKVMESLIGWPPGTYFQPVYFRGGRLMKMQNGILWWQDRFATSYVIQN